VLVGVVLDLLWSPGASETPSAAAVLLAAPSALYVLDRTSGRFVSSNAAFTALLGYPPATVAGWAAGQLEQLLHPDDRMHGARFLARASSSSADAVLTGHCRLRRVDGRYLPVQIEEVVIARASDGSATTVVGTMRDATEADVTVRRVSEHEARLQLLGEMTREVIATHDHHGHVTWVNPALTRLAGHGPEAITGRGLADLAHPEDRSLVQAAFAAALTGESEEVDWRLRKTDGAHVAVATVVERLPPRDAGEGSGPESPRLCSRTVDVGWRLQLAERAREVMQLRVRSDLLGSTILELNNLFTVVSNHAAAIAIELEGIGAISTELRKIEVAVGQAASLTRQLQGMGMSRDLRPHSIDVDGVVTSMARSLAHLLGPTVTLDTVLRSPAGGAAEFDEWELEQALTALVLNVRDAMSDGGTVRLVSERRTLDGPRAHPHGVVPAGTYAVVSVEDSAAGMSPAVLARVFEPGFTTKRDGLALGRSLSTIRQTIERAGGAVTVHSVRGQGTSVSLWMRAVQPGRAAERTPERLASPVNGVVGPSARILLVDNEPDVLHTTRRILERSGFTVTVAGSAPEALRMIEGSPPEERPQLLLTDVMMQPTSGRELGAAMAARFPGIAMAYVSGFGGGEGRPEVDGLQPLLAKPYGVQELLRFVNAALPA
jgi:PAS domain S-box-containing protein